MSLVLVVEDNEKNLKLLRTVLSHGGYRLLEATTAGEGVRMALESPPDLILMDIELPDFNGIEALRRLRADRRTENIPVIAVSASVMPNERRKIVESGFNGFIAKPIDVKTFTETVRRILADPR
jgi:two-component system cell cycle response regulator DivK